MKQRLFTRAIVCGVLLVGVSMPRGVVAQVPERVQCVPVNPVSGQVANHVFPELDSSSSTIINNRQTFKAYENQGIIYFTPTGVESAKIYINGQPLWLDEELKGHSGETLKVDVNDYMINGENTLQILDIQPSGASIEVDIPYPTLREGKPSQVGIDPVVFDVIDRIIEAEIEAGGIPGGQLLVAKDGVIVKNECYGVVKAYDHNGKVEDAVAVNEDTLYDLASNTKMYAANYAIQQLVAQGKLDTDATIDSIIKDFSEYDEVKQQLTVKHLLTHTAGFIPSPDYYNQSYTHPVMVDGKEVHALDINNDKKNDVYTQNSEEILEMIKRTPLEYAPSTKNVYSDVDYMLLGLIVEEISGQPLEVYTKEQLYDPLGLENTVFNPLQQGFEQEHIAATEIFGNTREHHVQFENIRTEVVQGEVHDEKAFYCMGGVSGHAGLFSNASDLAVLMQVMINGGGYGEVELFDQKTIDTFNTPSKTNDTYGLGWRRQGDGGYAWSFGEQVPDGTLGHTGWTGTSTSINMEDDVLIVWLSNTKNTPIADPVKSLNRMEGDAFQFDSAGTVSTLVYEGMIGTSEAALGDALLQMSLDRTSWLIRDIAKDGNCTTADYKAAAALVDVLFKQAQVVEGEGAAKEAAIERAQRAYDYLPEHEVKAELAKKYIK